MKPREIIIITKNHLIIEERLDKEEKMNFTHLLPGCTEPAIVAGLTFLILASLDRRLGYHFEKLCPLHTWCLPIVELYYFLAANFPWTSGPALRMNCLKQEIK